MGAASASNSVLRGLVGDGSLESRAELREEEAPLIVYRFLDLTPLGSEEEEGFGGEAAGSCLFLDRDCLVYSDALLFGTNGFRVALCR